MPTQPGGGSGCFQDAKGDVEMVSSTISRLLAPHWLGDSNGQYEDSIPIHIMHDSGMTTIHNNHVLTMAQSWTLNSTNDESRHGILGYLPAQTWMVTGASLLDDLPRSTSMELRWRSQAVSSKHQSAHDQRGRNWHDALLSLPIRLVPWWRLWLGSG